MDLKKIQEIGEQIKANNDTKKAIFELIDYKINDDMEKVLQKMENTEKGFSQKIENVLKEIKIVYWVVGIAMGVIVVLLSILAFALRH